MKIKEVYDISDAQRANQLAAAEHEQQFLRAVDVAIARMSVKELRRRYPDPPEPAHCSECFEGCPKCEAR